MKTDDKVFISHSSKDKEFVDRIVSDLAAHEISVWYDKLDIKIGDSTPGKINAGLSEEVERTFAQIGSEVKEIQPIADCGNPENHVLAGDILAPNNTRVIKELILDFISRLQ